MVVGKRVQSVFMCFPPSGGNKGSLSFISGILEGSETTSSPLYLSRFCRCSMEINFLLLLTMNHTTNLQYLLENMAMSFQYFLTKEPLVGIQIVRGNGAYLSDGRS